MASNAHKRMRKEYPSKFEHNSQWVTEELEGDESCSKVFFYQKEAVFRTKERLSLDLAEDPDVVKPVVIVAPTGAGKTGILSLLPYILPSKKVLILTPSKVITQQIGVAFGLRPDKKSFFEVCGLETNKSQLEGLLEPPRVITRSSEIKENLGNLVIVNAQRFGGKSGVTLSLEYRTDIIVEDVKAFFSKFDTLIVDEAHHYPADTWRNIVETFCEPAVGLRKKLIFVTATPYRRKEDGLEGFILGNGNEHRISYKITQEELTGKIIRKTDFVEKPDIAAFEQDLCELLAQQARSEPRFVHQAMVIVRTTNEATSVAEELNRSNGNATGNNYAVAIFGNKKATGEQIEEFTNGKYRIAVVCNLLNEGYNNPNVSVCVIRRKISSRILFEQFIGRCMRINLSIADVAIKPEAGVEPPRSRADRTVGKVLTYKQYDQKKLWDTRRHVAEADPEYDVGEEVLDLSI